MSLSDYLEARKKEREKQLKLEMRKKEAAKLKSIAIGTAAGAAVGVAAGVLFAPKSGEETREDIKIFAVDTTENIKEGVNLAKENIVYKTEEIKGDIKDKYDEFKERGVTELEKTPEEDDEEI